MVFERTTATLFERVQDLSFEEEDELVQVLLVYENQLKSACEPNRILLKEAEVLLMKRLIASQDRWGAINAGPSPKDESGRKYSISC